MNITVHLLLPTLKHWTSRSQAFLYVALQYPRFTHTMHYCTVL